MICNKIIKKTDKVDVTDPCMLVLYSFIIHYVHTIIRTRLDYYALRQTGYSGKKTHHAIVENEIQ